MPHNKVVFDWMEENSALFGVDVGSMLYVGWRYDCRPWWHDTFAMKIIRAEKVGVLEIFPRNHADLEVQVWAGRYNVVPILGDVREIEKHIQPGEYDMIFWDHGPEHVTWDDLVSCTEKLKSFARSSLVYCCPWGMWPQDEEDGNIHEVHRNWVSEEQMRQLFPHVKTFNSPGQLAGGELVAYAQGSELRVHRE